MQCPGLEEVNHCCLCPRMEGNEELKTGTLSRHFSILPLFFILMAFRPEWFGTIGHIPELHLTFCLAALFFHQALMIPHTYWNHLLMKEDPQSLTFHIRRLGVYANILNNGIPWSNFVLDCADLYRQGFHTSRVYQIYPSGSFLPLSVYCDMETDGGGWTVFQRRMDGSVDFYRGWDDYKQGFGTADGEYWLGLQNIHSLTARRNYELRIDMEDFENRTVYAKYKQFAVAPNAIHAEGSGYSLLVRGFTDGGAGDSMAYHNGLKFSTFDRNHQDPINCAQNNSGAFWYNACHMVNLNGLYLRGPHASYANGIHWATWTGYYYSLKATAMKMRPTSVG